MQNWHICIPLKESEPSQIQNVWEKDALCCLGTKSSMSQLQHYVQGE